ncbi:subtilisin-like serine protease PR1C [Stemphylium lycopersici]|uniref:Subtilisin-like serine protease PR1C n=1 Tax=Stemphylium lycopersici TaxID=183478 RepID=A0A364MVW7_STELY|nr:minor extracellular protease vpr protein [Stemphylium lycopersici]RAR00274.1 subtilisin-like serine protease PR1C [Stemphylium lycopersici]RAR05165.1 subtilisin-like serine protease PR1C [Stemphylium lycopersici]
MVHWSRFLPILGGAFLHSAAASSEELTGHIDSSSFYNALEMDEVSVEHRMDLNYKLFKGISFQVQNASDADATAVKIAKMDMVKQIWPVLTQSRPRNEVVWKGHDRNLGQAALQKRQGGGNNNDTYSTHVMTQVDRLRAQGITGKGTKIAVIDSGVDYLHPALGGGFGEGYLVSYGADLVGDDYDGSNTPVPDDDPMDECVGHGTHIAGIIAAQANAMGFTGAAPDVTLGAYRTYTCDTGRVSNDVLIAAFNQAFEDGSDIISCSMGYPSGWKEDPWAVAVSRIVDQGIPCILSATNDGNRGLFYTSTASNGKGVTAVAAIDNIVTPQLLMNATFTTGNSSTNSPPQSFGWTFGSPGNWGNISLPLWNINNDTTDPANGCDPYPADTPDLSEYLVLVRRGTCDFVQKATNAVNAGARYIMLYSNVVTVAGVSVENVDGVVGIGMVPRETGEEWVANLAAGVTVTVNIVDPDVAPMFIVSPPNPATGGFLSAFTPWGPTFEVEVKPQIAAPGGMILSTWPRALGSYAVLSGTSMATPLAAAITALVAQVRGTFDPTELESVLSATSNPNLFNDGSTTHAYLAPVPQQGGGILQAYDAAYTKTVLSVSSISFNDTANRIETTDFTIKNTGTEDVTYSITNVIAASAYTLEEGSILPMSFPNELVTQGATLSFSEDQVTVPASSEVSVSVSVSPPALDATRLPVFSGYITLNGTNGESLSLPYLGVVGSMQEATVLDLNDTYLTRSDDVAASPLPADYSFTFSSTPNTASNATVSLPETQTDFALGTSLLDIQVLPADGDTSSSLGSINNFPSKYVPRGLSWWRWNGQLADGSFAPAGSYKLFVRALHIFGDASKDSDYDSFTTSSFRIQYA